MLGHRVMHDADLPTPRYEAAVRGHDFTLLSRMIFNEMMTLRVGATPPIAVRGDPRSPRGCNTELWRRGNTSRCFLRRCHR